jgi:hypothetical protein
LACELCEPTYHSRGEVRPATTPRTTVPWFELHSLRKRH